MAAMIPGEILCIEVVLVALVVDMTYHLFPNEAVAVGGIFFRHGSGHLGHYNGPDPGGKLACAWFDTNK